MIDRLNALIARASSRGYVRYLKQDAELLAWVMAVTKDLPEDAELSERVYVALHGIGTAICPLGNHKVFNTLDKGFRFCASGCQCRREEQARKITARQAEVSPEERKRRQDRMAATLLERHGVANPGQVEEGKVKAKETNRARYGGDHHMASEAVREKIRATNLERHGVAYPGQSPVIMDKVRATNQERHGAPNTMHLARAAFEMQTGFSNPFFMQEFQDKATATMVARYGVEKALAHPDIYAKMVENVTKRYGATNVAMLPAVLQKIQETCQRKYNRKFVGQDHIPDEGYAILQDPEAFRAMLETSSLRETAYRLGLSYDGARKYVDRYGIHLPKSSYETAIADFLDRLSVRYVRGSRMIIPPLELDFAIPEKNLAIEFCGLYWHSEKIKADSDYHLKKLLRANEAGYRLLTIFEDEWVLNREVVCSRIMNALGLTTRGVAARKLTIRSLSSDEAKDFLDLFHLQGGGARGYLNLGAFDGDALVGCMTFSRGRIAAGGNQGCIELLRFATDGRNHPGLASRLFQTFVRAEQPGEVVSYADRRWSDGKLYHALGFTADGATDPNYWYLLNGKYTREHRFRFRKSELKGRVPDWESKTEIQIMHELGYFRIFDCGSLRFIWNAAGAGDRRPVVKEPFVRPLPSLVVVPTHRPLVKGPRAETPPPPIPVTSSWKEWAEGWSEDGYKPPEE